MKNIEIEYQLVATLGDSFDNYCFVKITFLIFSSENTKMFFLLVKWLTWKLISWLIHYLKSSDLFQKNITFSSGGWPPSHWLTHILDANPMTESELDITHLHSQVCAILQAGLRHRASSEQWRSRRCRLAPDYLIAETIARPPATTLAICTASHERRWNIFWCFCNNFDAHFTKHHLFLSFGVELIIISWRRQDVTKII